MLSLAHSAFMILACSQILLVLSQNSESQQENAVSKGLSEFSIEILDKLTSAAPDQNIIISTYSIWTLLAILNAGANGRTSTELMDVLRISSNTENFRSGFEQIQSELMRKSSGVELDMANAIFIDRPKRLIPEFQNQVSSQYNINVLPVDFRQTNSALKYIDNFVANATRGKIPHFINFDDINNAQLLLITAIYFKGDWNLPFNSSATLKTDFYDETITRPIGKVMMMYQVGPYPFTKLSQLKGHVIELPYGQDEKYSMIVILPMKNVSLKSVLTQLSSLTMKTIFEDLERAKTEFYGEDVQVYLPQFSITSDFILNQIITEMGITDLFSPLNADLRRITSDNLFLSRLIQRATIDVNEEGTVAAAVSGGTISYKSPPGTFNASHPFLYFIVESVTKSILFAGKFSNPNQV